MSPIFAHTITATTSFYSLPQNKFSPEKRLEMSKFLMQEVTDQHTDRQINNMLITAFNRGTYRHSDQIELRLSNVEFEVPAGETCVVPNEVSLDGCKLMSAGTMEFSNGSLHAVRHGATVVARGDGATARAFTFGARAMAVGRGAFATAESDGTAFAMERGTTAVAFFGGTAYADSEHSEAFAKGVNSCAHARIYGARAYAYEVDSTATARSGAIAHAMKSGAFAIAVNARSVAQAEVRGAIALAKSKDARAIAWHGGRAVASGDGAIEENNGKRVIVKSRPVARYSIGKRSTSTSVLDWLLARYVSSARQSSGVNFQGRFGNNLITDAELD